MIAHMYGIEQSKMDAHDKREQQQQVKKTANEELAGLCAALGLLRNSRSCSRLRQRRDHLFERVVQPGDIER